MTPGLVLAHGCFDCLHIGHLYYLMDAARLGKRLVVSITADKYINKGPGRPCFPEQHRREMLEALRCVSDVMIVNGPSGVPAIEWFQPEFYVKGPDYKGGDNTGKLDEERQAVEKFGGQLKIIETRIQCSSGLILSGQLLREKIAANRPRGIGEGDYGVE